MGRGVSGHSRGVPCFLYVEGANWRKSHSHSGGDTTDLGVCDVLAVVQDAGTWFARRRTNACVCRILTVWGTSPRSSNPTKENRMPKILSTCLERAGKPVRPVTRRQTTPSRWETSTDDVQRFSFPRLPCLPDRGRSQAHRSDRGYTGAGGLVGRLSGPRQAKARPRAP